MKRVQTFSMILYLYKIISNYFLNLTNILSFQNEAAAEAEEEVEAENQEEDDEEQEATAEATNSAAALQADGEGDKDKWFHTYKWPLRTRNVRYHHRGESALSTVFRFFKR